VRREGGANVRRSAFIAFEGNFVFDPSTNIADEVA
jgi:hypothetical protein